MSGVYQIICEKTGHLYVGGSKSPKRRWSRHRYLLNKGHHKNIRLQDAWKTYGETSFSFALIEACDERDLREREQWWIDNTEPSLLFNLNLDADMPPSQTGNRWKKTKEAILKTSTALKGRKSGPRSPETKRKLSDSLSGRSLSLEHRQNLSTAAIGKKMSDAARQKMSEKAKQRVGRTVSEETRKKIAESLRARKRGKP